MDAQEFRERKSELDRQIADLQDRRDALLEEQRTLIEKDLADIGIVFSSEVTCSNQDYDRCCTFNGVWVDRNYSLYLEFVYDQTYTYPNGFESTTHRTINPHDNFMVVTPEATFNYQQFMSQYQ